MTTNNTSLSIPKDRKSAHTSKLTKNGLATALRVFGIIYFIIVFLGSVIMWLNSTKEVDEPLYGSITIKQNVIDATARGMAIGGILTSVIILLICFGIALMIEQNIYMLNKLNNNS